MILVTLDTSANACFGAWTAKARGVEAGGSINELHSLIHSFTTQSLPTSPRMASTEATGAHASDEAHGGQPTQPHRREGMHLFKRKTHHPNPQNVNGGQEQQDQMEKGQTQDSSAGRPKKSTPGIEPDGESGRSWFHPWHFLRICWKSSSHMSKWTNVLWPFTIAALILYFGWGQHMSSEETSNISLWVFILAYIGMVPAANLVGFAGQELARKIPKVMGVILETTFGSIVEIILFLILIIHGGRTNVPVIQAAILGSILANLLLCLGMLTLSCILPPLY